MPILKRCSGSYPAHTHKHTKRQTHIHSIPLRLLFNLLPKLSPQKRKKRKSRFLPTASQCQKHPSGIARQITKESLRRAVITLWLFRRDSCGDDEKDAGWRSSPRTGLKGKLSEKRGKKGRKRCCCLAIVSVRFHLQSSLCWPDYTDEPHGVL